MIYLFWRRVDSVLLRGKAIMRQSGKQYDLVFFQFLCNGRR